MYISDLPQFTALANEIVACFFGVFVNIFSYDIVHNLNDVEFYPILFF